MEREFHFCLFFEFFSNKKARPQSTRVRGHGGREMVESVSEGVLRDGESGSSCKQAINNILCRCIGCLCVMAAKLRQHSLSSVRKLQEVGFSCYFHFKLSNRSEIEKSEVLRNGNKKVFTFQRSVTALFIHYYFYLSFITIIDF